MKTKRSCLWNPIVQYPAYAVKSDDSKERPRIQYPAYAVKGDDGKERPRIPIS